ncbi:APC family permease [Sphaerisporangium sp. NPDC051011]|uniref:APC family permease n=1 Tax=Sphaerisporangium sp. NPDC051011 TaxID=3155792 RepID=UPI0033F70716
MATRMMDEGQRRGGLRAGALGAPALLFLVMAFQAPLTSAAGNVPLLVGLGNGVGAPAAFVLCGIVLTFFAVPFAAMSRRITNAGAFYSYVSAGIGKPAGAAAGWVALFTYNVLLLVPVAYTGIFGASIFKAEIGIDLPWQVYSLGILVVVWLIGMRGIELNTVLLSIFLVLEVAILISTVVAILFKDGLTGAAFAPNNVFSGNFGLGFMFAILSFIGFEATAVFGEETRDPKKTVARATFAAVWAIVGIYGLSTWASVSIHPADKVSEYALEHADTYMGDAVIHGLGGWSSHAFNWLLLVSLLACCMAVHNMASRYLYAFGRDGMLPASLSRTHPKFATPYVASSVQALLMIIIVVICSLSGADPYTTLAALAGGFATVGVLVLMLTTLVAAVFFLRSTEEALWVRIVAPVLAFAGLGTVLVIILRNFDTLAGASTFSSLLPWAFPAIGVLGYIHGRVVGREVNLAT